jgi:hypothetical protein
MANGTFAQFRDITTTARTTETESFGRAHPNGTVEVLSSGVATGATILVEGSLSKQNWDLIAQFTVSSNGSGFARFTNAAYRYYRARASSYTDGTYTVYMLLYGDTGNGTLSGLS